MSDDKRSIHSLNPMFDIVRFTDTCDFEILERFNSYGEADVKFDEWADRYPNSWVEIIDAEDNI